MNIFALVREIYRHPGHGIALIGIAAPQITIAAGSLLDPGDAIQILCIVFDPGFGQYKTCEDQCRKHKNSYPIPLERVDKSR